MQTPARPTLRDRSRELAVLSILDTAIPLFVEQGYEATTMAQIAEQAGISQRSLFRYFGAKEDLVCGAQDELGEMFARVVAEELPRTGPWDALRAGWIAVTTANHTPDEAFVLSRLILGTPALLASYLVKRQRWQDALVPLVTDRIGRAGHDDAELVARAVIAASFSCCDAAGRIWVTGSPADDWLALYDRCVRAVRASDLDAPPA
ncbi:TetR family transcriptional regulator [Pseudonocardia sp. NPDC046786]|uniref:TetR/AcrR family transcriptional regulator n=1 Tax=Pseudonocardia sp. NPDC046786 TaxID=3155471 RepID=UPI0033F71216